MNEGGDGGEPEHVPSIDELWDMAERLFPGKMKCLHDEYLEMLRNDCERRSLSKDVHTEDCNLQFLTKELTSDTFDSYTPKFNSVFLYSYKKYGMTTSVRSRSLDQKYVRLGRTDGERNDQAYDAKVHDVKHSFTSDKSVQLALLFNDLLGLLISSNAGCSLRFEDAIRESPYFLRSLFRSAAHTVTSLFDFTRNLKPELFVGVDFEHKLPYCTGEADFAMTVETVTEVSDTVSVISREYVSIVVSENARLWIAWGPLTGQEWTAQERNAFFKPKRLRIWGHPPSYEQEFVNSWKCAEDVLERIGSSRVEVKYDRSEMGSGKTEEESDRQIGQATTQSSTNMEPGKFTPSYFIEDANGNPEDITELLESAKFKRSFDSCHNALAAAASCAVYNGCSRIAIADGLTFIAGSLNKLEKTEGITNPTDSEDVLDAHFHNTHMVQTHDQDSFVHIVNYFTEGVMSLSSIRSIGHQLLLYAKPGQDAKLPTVAPTELAELMRGHGFKFRSANRCRVGSPALERSRQRHFTRGARKTVVEALADICKMFPEFYTKLDHITSDSFELVKWHLLGPYVNFEGGERLYTSRCQPVARVQRHIDTQGSQFVLKEFHPDNDSVASMKRELEAYYRVEKLPYDHRKWYVADLVSFGSLNLDGIPRLFLLLKYAEGPNRCRSTPVNTSVFSPEAEKTARLLGSVGMPHNNLRMLNYEWQSGEDVNWHVKVFDFNHVRFSETSVSNAGLAYS